MKKKEEYEWSTYGRPEMYLEAGWYQLGELKRLVDQMELVQKEMSELLKRELGAGKTI